MVEESKESLPSKFQGIIECDEEEREGYRNKVEFTIGYKFSEDLLTVGFMKGAMNQGTMMVDDPIDMPHISS